MIPTRTLDQRSDALVKANKIRVERARWKQELKARRVSIQSLLQDPPACLESMKVIDLMLAMPYYGAARVNRILVQQRISAVKTVGGLSDRQRRELISIRY